MKKDINYYLNLPYKINLLKLDDGDYSHNLMIKNLINLS